MYVLQTCGTHFKSRNGMACTGAQLLAGFSGELEDVVNNFEAATMSSGNGVVTLTVLERARSQLVRVPRLV